MENKNMAPEKKAKRNRRGYKKCSSCGMYIGCRSKGCKNDSCVMYIDKSLLSVSYMNPVKLNSESHTNVYSVRFSRKINYLRNFVAITDTTLSNEDDFTSIVKRNAICLVDTCKYDASNNLEIICKHVKCTKDCKEMAQNIDIDKNIVEDAKLDQTAKSFILNVYEQNLKIFPAIQRIDLLTFVVACAKSQEFPVGRIHLSIYPDSECKTATSCFFYCNCKYFTSVHYLCLHLLIVLIAIKSNNNLRSEFNIFYNKFCSTYWPQNLNIENNLDEQIIETPMQLQEPESLNSQTYKEMEILESPKQTNALIAINNNFTNLVCPEQNTVVFQPNETIDSSDMNQYFSLNVDELNKIGFEPDYSSNNDQIILTPDENGIFYSIIPCSSKEVVGNNNNIENLNDKIICEDIERVSPESSNFDNITLLSFNNWLIYVIERINQDFNSRFVKEEKICYEFHIHESFFAILHEKFSIGNRKRLPNKTLQIKVDNRDLYEYLWYFHSKSFIENIFKCGNLKLLFEKPDTNNVIEDQNYNSKYRVIKPKIPMPYIKLELNKNSDNNSNFIIKWVPNIYVQSKFGLLTIEFSIGFKVE